MNNIKNQNGAISIFVFLSMTFFLVFVLGAYSIVSTRMQTQTMSVTELQSIYKKDSKEIGATRYASASEIIPVYNAEQFILIGSNEYIEIDGKIYKFGANVDSSTNYSYLLKGNIIIDMDKYFSQSGSNIQFLDEKFYSDDYTIDKGEYDLYYYKQTIDVNNVVQKAYFKTVAYQYVEEVATNSFVGRFTEEERVAIATSSIKESNKYSILNELDKYKYNGKFEFLLLYNTGLGNAAFNKDAFVWWKQNKNPLKINEKNPVLVDGVEKTITDGSVKADGFEPVNDKVAYTDYGTATQERKEYWGGLVYGDTKSVLNGSTYTESNWYTIGIVEDYNHGIPGIPGLAATDLVSSKAYLFTRVDL